MEQEEKHIIPDWLKSNINYAIKTSREGMQRAEKENDIVIRDRCNNLILAYKIVLNFEDKEV